MKKMPELVQLGKEFGDLGLVILGINFDEDPAALAAAVRKHGLTWPQVHAPTAARGQERFWREISDITGLPRVLLLDRRGVLRYDGYPHLARLRRELTQILGRRL